MSLVGTCKVCKQYWIYCLCTEKEICEGCGRPHQECTCKQAA